MCKYICGNFTTRVVLFRKDLHDTAGEELMCISSLNKSRPYEVNSACLVFIFGLFSYSSLSYAFVYNCLVGICRKAEKKGKILIETAEKET